MKNRLHTLDSFDFAKFYISMSNEFLNITKCKLSIFEALLNYICGHAMMQANLHIRPPMIQVYIANKSNAIIIIKVVSYY